MIWMIQFKNLKIYLILTVKNPYGADIWNTPNLFFRNKLPVDLDHHYKKSTMRWPEEHLLITWMIEMWENWEIKLRLRQKSISNSSNKPVFMHLWSLQLQQSIHLPQRCSFKFCCILSLSLEYYWTSKRIGASYCTVTCSYQVWAVWRQMMNYYFSWNILGNELTLFGTWLLLEL